MKQIIGCKVFMITLFFVLYACAGVPVKDCQSGSADEEEIIKVIMKHESAWNEQDISGFMATYHNSALIEYGCTGPSFSKSKFADIIERMMSEYPTVKLMDPRSDISGNKAVVKVTSTELGDESHLFRLEMLKENEQWYISKETCY